MLQTKTNVLYLISLTRIQHYFLLLQYLTQPTSIYCKCLPGVTMETLSNVDFTYIYEAQGMKASEVDSKRAVYHS